MWWCSGTRGGLRSTTVTARPATVDLLTGMYKNMFHVERSMHGSMRGYIPVCTDSSYVYMR